MDIETTRKRSWLRTAWLALAALVILAVAACGADGDADDTPAQPAAPDDDNGQTADAVEDFPQGAIEYTIPYPAGGGTDAIARILAPLVSEELDAQIDIVVRSGGAGATGATHLLSQPPDGHTMLGIESGVATTGPAGRSVPYDPNDLEPVALMTDDPWFLLASMNSGLTSIDDFTALAENSPGDLRIGIAGVMSSDHYAWLLMARSMDFPPFRYIAYGGGAPVAQALYAGEIDVALDTARSIDEDLVVPLAVFAEERMANFPDVPTTVESGFEGAVASLWQGIAVRAGTPDAVVNALSTAIVNAASTSEFADGIGNLGLAPSPLSHAEFKEKVETERAQAQEMVDFIEDAQIEEGEVDS